MSRTRAGDVWAVIPVKSFARAKSRLAPVLTPQGRAALARAMLIDVLAVVAGGGRIAGILLVSGDPEAARIGRECGAATLMDPLETGTNGAVQLGLDHLKALGAGRIVVVQSDIPRLTAEEFEGTLDALDRADLVIVPARDGGTCMLALAHPGLMAPAFGPLSAARHRRAAADLGLDAVELALAGAGHDIDRPEDLPIAGDGAAGRHTRRALGDPSHFIRLRQGALA